MVYPEREPLSASRRQFLRVMAVVAAVMAGCAPRGEAATSHDPGTTHEATPTTTQPTPTQETILSEITPTVLPPTPEPSPTFDTRVTVTPAGGEEFRFDPSILEQLPPVPDEVDRAMRNVTYSGVKPPMEPVNGVIVRIGANPVFGEVKAPDGKKYKEYDYDVAYREGSSWKVVSIIGYPSSEYTIDAVTFTGERVPDAFQTIDIDIRRQQVIGDGVISIPGLEPVYPGSPVTVYLSTGPESPRKNGYENTKSLSELLNWPFEQSMGTVFYQAPTS